MCRGALLAVIRHQHELSRLQTGNLLEVNPAFRHTNGQHSAAGQATQEPTAPAAYSGLTMHQYQSLSLMRQKYGSECRSSGLPAMQPAHRSSYHRKYCLGCCQFLLFEWLLQRFGCPGCMHMATADQAHCTGDAWYVPSQTSQWQTQPRRNVVCRGPSASDLHWCMRPWRTSCPASPSCGRWLRTTAGMGARRHTSALLR